MVFVKRCIFLLCHTIFRFLTITMLSYLAEHRYSLKVDVKIDICNHGIVFVVASHGKQAIQSLEDLSGVVFYSVVSMFCCRWHHQHSYEISE